MTTSSVPEPPILADTEQARNCLGLNATVLPGLGTFRHGARLRGTLEMTVAVVGTVWFCKTLFLMAGDISGVAQSEATASLSDGVSAWRLYVPGLLASAAVVVVSWISGVRYGRAILKG